MGVCARIDPKLGLVALDGSLDGLVVGAAGGLGALAREVLDGEDHDRGQDAQNDDNDEEFDEGEAPFALRILAAPAQPLKGCLHTFSPQDFFETK